MIDQGPADGGCVVCVDPARGSVQVRRLAGGAIDERKYADLVREMTRT